MEPLSERAAATRSRILQAAAAELAETGDIEVAAVARRAGLSVGLPYRYFGTRSGLMSALLADFYDRLVSETVLGHFTGRTWLERWRDQLTRWVDWVYDEPLAPVVLGRMVGDARVAAMEADCARQVIALGAKHVAAGQAEGAVTRGRDPELMSAAVVGGMRSVLAVVLDQDPRPERAAVLEEIWQFTTAALGARPASAAP
ncbi:TetR/AcrR family transcriptional regulator [Nonomuraea sp. FMUSA5-5]|uniref:TetR/AcrR family transcriptional regulator n=1 Tax=Nonomuraea composti TaxID=2720023 RepID=A0ABX1B7R7_9ACTN|nr:TetR/AcrR family transcriptional regulator [Nonomuraea sp. FMUSA5-5]